MTPELAFVQSASVSPATSPVRLLKPLPLITRRPTPSPATSASPAGSRALKDLEPCLDTFERLARDSPLTLLERMQRGDLTNPQLSFAAEAAGLISDTRLVVAVLAKLARSHPSAPVREGAIYGLEKHLISSDEARSTLREAAEADVSPAVRAAARDALAFA